MTRYSKIQHNYVINRFMSCHVMSCHLCSILTYDVYITMCVRPFRLLVRAVGLLQCEEDVERLLLENVGNDFKKGEQSEHVYSKHSFLFSLSPIHQFVCVFSSSFLHFLSFSLSFSFFLPTFFAYSPPSPMNAGVRHIRAASTTRQAKSGHRTGTGHSDDQADSQVSIFAV